MGFSYRKSVKMGPFRMTASKSGISYSAGIKGARVTRRADGKVQRTLSAPGTGLRHTTTYGNKRRAARSSTPPARRQATASPRTVRLSGRRSSTSPRVPPASVLPYTAKGYLATVTIHQGGIHLERTRAGRLNGNRTADIAWRDVVAVDFCAPNLIRNGHIHFATASDPRGLTATGNGNSMAAVARNPHAIMFTLQQYKTYKRIRDILMGNAPWPSPGQAPTWQPTPAPARPVTTHAPGWYPDNYNPAFARWWDGAQWTDHTRPL
jgi:hypothetical protein